MMGAYVIVAELNTATAIQVGKRYRLTFEKAFYAYVGSALSGLERRLARHLSTQKSAHWHIDYLLKRATVSAIVYAESSLKVECLIARALSRELPSVPGFGCSDCRCPSHLFFAHDLGTLKQHVVNAFENMNLAPVVSTWRGGGIKRSQIIGGDIQMPTCGECKLLVPNPKGQGWRCMGKRCGATKMTPETNANKCKKFEGK